MLLEPPDRERGFKRERLLRVFLTHPDGGLSKRALSREAETTDAWAVKLTNQLEGEGLVEGTTVLDPRGLYDYWRDKRVSPSKLAIALQSPVETIRDTGLTHAFTTYRAENARQGFLFTSNTAVYVDPDETEEWLSVIEANGLIGGGNTEFRVTDSHVFYPPRRDSIKISRHKSDVSRAGLTDLVSWHLTESRLGVYDATVVNGLVAVSIPQLIVDLLDEGGPCVEAAERLIEMHHE